MMNESDWAKVESALQNLYDPVDLTCDGFRLTLFLSRIEIYKNAIAVYVDGWFKLSWLFEDCEQRRRFFCPETRRVYGKNEFKKISRRTLKQVGIDPDKTVTRYRSHWTSFRRLRRHLERHNQDIGLIEKSKTEAL
jgi:hypothetical protein